MNAAGLRQRMGLLPAGVIDTAIGVLCGAELFLSSLGLRTPHASVVVNLITAGGVAVALSQRRRTPLLAAVAFMVVAAIREATQLHVDGAIGAVVALLALAYPIARQLTSRPALTGLALLTAGLLLIAGIGRGAVASLLFPALVFVLSPWIVGRTVRSRVLLARELEEQAAALEADRQNTARRAVLDERRRIARELHDVVAHSLSVMVIQAGAGRRQAREHPERAAGCAELIERLGRETLTEMRLLLGVMRPEGEPAAREPQPGLGALAHLITDMGTAGLAVELRVDGDPQALPVGPDLAAYRIVQEALTNVLKHAGPARAIVTVSYAADAVELEVADNGTGTLPSPLPRGGHGVLGMRERAAMYGGEVEAGPQPTGGWIVRARLLLADLELEAMPA